MSHAYGVPHVSFIGMMGSGKTTVGRLLGAQLDLEVTDVDAVIVREQRMSIPQMFERHGEQRFRDVESETTARLLASNAAALLSFGGGVVMRAENREALRERSLVVWLRANAETLITRNGSGVGRPMLTGSPQDRIRVLTAEREPLYRETAHVTIDVDDLSAPQVVECVRAAVATLDPAHWAA